MYIRKTEDEYHIEGYYSPQYGWETVTVEATYKDAIKQVRCYRANEPYPFRVKLHRVKKAE